MPAKIYEIVSHGTFQGQQVLNRWHFFDSDGVADPATLCLDFTNGVLNPLLPMLNTGFQWNSLTYQQIYPTMQLQVGYAVGYPRVGGNAGAAAANSLAVSVRYNLGVTVNLDGSPVTKYIKRGGKRLGGLTVAGGTGDAFTVAAFRTDIDTSFNALPLMGGDGWNGCVVHFPPSPAPVPPATTSPRLPPTRYALITGHITNATYGSQVSRKPGHGR